MSTDRNIELVWRISKPALDLASVRYRALLPIVALSENRVRSRLLSKPDGMKLDSASHLIVVKCFSPADVELVKSASRSGIHTFFDLCDNIFVNGYGHGSNVPPIDVFREMVPFLRTVVVPTPALATVVQQATSGRLPVYVIPDGVEDIRMLKRQRAALIRMSDYRYSRAASYRHRLKSGFLRFLRSGIFSRSRSARIIVWFGNHGSPWSTFGLADIRLFKDVLERIAARHNVRLLVISNNRARFEAEIRPMEIHSEYVDWTPEVLHAALRMADVVIAPSALDEFARYKSANRTLLALNSGVPVVATPTFALEPLRHCVWLDDPYEGINTYLCDPKTVREHITSARALIRREFSPAAIADRWQKIL